MEVEYKYVLSEQLGFVNGGIEIKIWGPTTQDTIISKLKQDGHILGTRPGNYEELFTYIAYCVVCTTSVGKVLEDYYMGHMLDIKCKRRT
jgi:hypothetical protein